MPVFVGTVEISDDEVFREMQYHPASSMEDARDAAAQALVVRELLRQEAARQGLDTGDSAEDATLQALLEREVSVPPATDDTCRRYYDANQDRFRAADAPEKIVPFEAVVGKIRDYLQTRSVREGIRAYVLALAAETHVAGFDLAASL